MKLLVPEHPLVVLPSLAEQIGINEAIVLQQVHYWAAHSSDEGWVYNALPDWLKQFPWLSEATLRRVVRKLREGGQLEVEQRGNDRTNHYRVNYAEVPDLHAIKVSASSDQSERLSNKTETTQRKTPTPSVKKKVNKKPVTDSELVLAAAVVVAFNDIAGTRLGVDAHLVPIVGRIREKPELTEQHHRRIIEAVFDGDHWWKGSPGIGIVYGNGAQFEQSIELARAAKAKEKKPTTIDVNAEAAQIRREQGLE